MMPEKKWKRRERQAARFFGAERLPLSGGNSRHGRRDDSTHHTLYHEHKTRKKNAAVNLWLDTDRKRKEDNFDGITVVTLSVDNAPGFWVLCHCNDLVAVANQRELAKKERG